jgi:hypothetical protein
MSQESIRTNLAMVALRSTDPIDWAAIAENFGVDQAETVSGPQESSVAAVTFAIPGGSAGLAYMRA